MITDAQLRPSLAQSLAGAAATVVSTNAIDLLAAVNDLGVGASRRAIASVAAAFTGGTAVTANLIESANADLSSATVIVPGVAVVDANAIAGKVLLDVVIPQSTKRYIGFQFVTTGTHTTGTVNAHLVLDTDRNKYLPANLGR